MTEGLNLTLSAATLLSMIGIAVKLYTANKPQKLEQPITTRQASEPIPSDQCHERHVSIDEQTKNLFSRMNHAEQRIAALEATQKACEKRLDSIDTKLDQLLRLVSSRK